MGQSKPTFSKVLSHDFASRLRLPPYFTYEFGKLLSECSIMTVGCSDDEEEWRVKVDEVAEEGQCFTNGWPEFVRDLGVERHDFLVFWLESQSKFLVADYNEDGTAKIVDHLPTQGKVSSKKEEESHMVRSPSTVDRNKNKKMTKTLFCVKMRPSNKYRLTIPTCLRGAEMMGNRCLVLKDLREREWPVLMYYSRGSMKCPIWGDFKKQNGLLNKDTCTFSYTPVRMKKVTMAIVVAGCPELRSQDQALRRLWAPLLNKQERSGHNLGGIHPSISPPLLDL